MVKINPMQTNHPYRKQKNLTITNDQAVFIMSNRNTLSQMEMSRLLGLTINVVRVNSCLLGVKSMSRKKVVKHLPQKAKVIDFDNGKGYFDLNKWSKAYAL